MPTSSVGKRQGFAHIASHPLTKRIVPAFLMSGFARLFAHAAMGFCRKHRRIRLPEIAVAGALTKCGWNPMPQASTGVFAVVAKHKRQNVTGSSQQDGPEPAFVDPFLNETPGVIDFQHVLCVRDRECLLQRGQGLEFFLISPPVCSETRRISG